ncbi:high mobility group protein 20A-like isoform X2 [Oppia nitens]|uniref:high mobility group protein 20A-like isoform X2 n=1 Tax=Oppia nitens TaxID=1686743 RepID=UPI0023DBC7F1|nr:high mobility group protein 20A-like isoform X2 [Oppia nitens]
MANNTGNDMNTTAAADDNNHFAAATSAAENHRRSSSSAATTTTPKRRLSSDGHKGASPGAEKGSSSAAKRQKRGKQLRDQNAPRVPLNGYVRFLNSNRDRAKVANPGLSFADITKILAAEWTAMDVEAKRKYLDEAEKAREVYIKELEEYQRTDAYQEFLVKQKQRREQKLQQKQLAASGGGGPANSGGSGHGKHGSGGGHLSVNNDENQALDTTTINTTTSGGGLTVDVSSGTLDLPIFTEEFLDHNRTREHELRQLRKLNTEYEEQNAILSKHIDNMKSAIEKLESETVQQRSNIQQIGQHLNQLRQTLVKSFAAVGMPGTGDVPTMDNVDDYIVKLHAKLTVKDKSRDTEALAERVRGIVAAIDYGFH